MDFHVGSLSDLINQKTQGKTSSSTLFQNVSSGPGKEVHFKVIPIAKRKKVPDQDETTGILKHDGDNDDTSYQPKLKRFKQNNAQNAAKRLQVAKPALKEKNVTPEEDKRTIFVGNLPCNIKVARLKKMFKTYGEIESARLRCPPVKNPKIPKRVAVIKKDFHPERTNIVGYVRFSSVEEATAALQANGILFLGHHLRVDISSGNGIHDQKKAVFVGNVHFGAEENDLWNLFEHCGEIDSIRIVRDSQTGVGKGFAYINFKDLSSVELALKLDGQQLKDRAIRVHQAVKKVKAKNDGPQFGRKGPGQKFKGVGKGDFAGSKRFVGDEKKFGSKAESFKKKKQPRQKFKEGVKEKFVGKKHFREDKEFGEYSESAEKVKRKLKFKRKTEFGEKSENAEKVKKKLKFKPKIEKNKSKLVKKSSDDGPSFLGNKVDEKSKGKTKKKKLSKAELKKQVLAFQLQLKKGGISNQ